VCDKAAMWALGMAELSIGIGLGAVVAWDLIGSCLCLSDLPLCCNLFLCVYHGERQHVISQYY
jgi:hypothetical protein